MMDANVTEDMSAEILPYGILSVDLATPVE
jgi:hypothetical protein